MRLPVHAAYDLPPAIPVMPLAENMAEKIARLTRRTPARDVYDLAWISSTSPHSGFDRVLVRRLAVLKNWVDQHGLSSPPAVWRPVTGAVPYSSDRWHAPATRRTSTKTASAYSPAQAETPRLDAAAISCGTHFGVSQTSTHRTAVVTGGAGSRNLVLEAIGSLPGSRFTNRPLY